MTAWNSALRASLVIVCGYFAATAWGTKGLCPAELAAARKAEWGASRLPQLTPSEEERLIEEFARDGRPILLVTDTREVQRSGVVTTYKTVGEEIWKMTGGRVGMLQITPDAFRGFDIPYQDLRIARMPRSTFAGVLLGNQPQAIHVAVEGPLGMQARRYLQAWDIPFTTAYHTEFPDYVAAAIQPYLPWAAGWAKERTRSHLQRFHSASSGVLVAAKTLKQKLQAEGYPASSLRDWSRGVDADKFRPDTASDVYAHLKGPISVYVGRVAAEKSLEDFLAMDIPGTKVVVGDGPVRQELQQKFPDAVFMGSKAHAELPAYFASADIFVFPSRTDTFGLVQLEALASGIPVVAYRVAGPKDVITSDEVGRLADFVEGADKDNVARLTTAWYEAIGLDHEVCREYAQARSWRRTALEFLHFLSRIDPLR